MYKKKPRMIRSAAKSIRTESVAMWGATILQIPVARRNKQKKGRGSIRSTQDELCIVQENGVAGVVAT